MAGTFTRKHADRIGEALRAKFQREQDGELLQRMVSLYVAGLTCAQVGEAVGKPMATVNRWLRNAGVEIRSSSHGKKGSTWSNARRAATPARPKPEPVVVDGQVVTGQALLTYRAVGNRTISPQGYIVVHIGRKQRRYEHVLIAEQALGRRLGPDEVVHHINCIRSDNRPENLLICSRSYHVGLHARMRRDPYWREIERIGRALSKPQ